MVRWSLIAGRIPGRTAEEIEKYWTSRSSTSKWMNRNWLVLFISSISWWGSLRRELLFHLQICKLPSTYHALAMFIDFPSPLFLLGFKASERVFSKFLCTRNPSASYSAYLMCSEDRFKVGLCVVFSARKTKRNEKKTFKPPSLRFL